jgi:hypothetical protein
MRRSRDKHDLNADNKTCIRCFVNKSIYEFTKSPAYKSGRRSACRECVNKKSRELTITNGGKLSTPRCGLSVLQKFEYNVYYSIDGCHYWCGSTFSNGYGRFSIKRIGMKAHRVSYMLYKGDITNGLLVCHSCDNRQCVNPDHLFLGTQKDNIQDCIKKGRRLIAPFTKSNELRKKAVIQLLNNVVVGEYGSIVDAARSINTTKENIGYALKSDRRTAVGFTWKYKNI